MTASTFDLTLALLRRFNRFLATTDREVLRDIGKVNAEIARVDGQSEFEKYRLVQYRLDRVVAETKRFGEGAANSTQRKGGTP